MSLMSLYHGKRLLQPRAIGGLTNRRRERSRVQVVSPVSLQRYQPDVVIVMNPVYLVEINRDLNNLNIHPKLIPINDL